MKDHYDVVIVGGGLSGTTAAVEAIQNHLSTLIVEKGRTWGGNGNYVEGAFGVDSNMQKQNDIKLNKAEILKDELQYSHYEADARHLHNFIDQSGSTIDWLESLGVKFSKVGPQGDSWATIHTFEGGGGQAIHQLFEIIQKSEADIQTSTRVTELKMGDDGHICGVKVVNEQNGQTCMIKTNSVILATGGYVDNDELVKQKTPYADRLFRVSSGKSTGDGLLMAWDIGAEKYQMGTIQYGGGALKDRTRPAFAHFTSQVGMAATQEALLWINEQGNRFVNEDIVDNMCHAGNALLNQSRVFSILGSNNIKHLMEQGLYKELGNSPVSPDKLDNLQAELDEFIDQHVSFVTKADTVADLADQLGLVNLPTTISNYNEMVEAGEDEEFFKADKYMTSVDGAPYYAIELGVGASCGVGGLRVDDDNQVLNAKGFGIPGLYAAGNDAAGMIEGETYSVSVPGSTAGYAVFSAKNAVDTIVRSLVDA